MTAPRETKRIKNVKYRQQKANYPSNRNNTDDEILQVLSMLNEYQFLNQVIHNEGQVQSILCYTEKKMTDFKMFLTVLLVQPELIWKAFFFGQPQFTEYHPICIGPMLLHKDSSYETYNAFFSHRLELIIPEELLFVSDSDDEKAMPKATRYAFPSATRLLRTKNLKDNIKYNMQHWSRSN